MTNERARANDETRPPERVSYVENKEGKGLALADERFFQERMAKIKDLRDRQAAYEASLPQDLPDIVIAARRIMHPDGDNYPEGIEEALHLSSALEAMIQAGDLDADGRARDAALYLADRLTSAMHRAVGNLDRISDILCNHARIEREAAAGDKCITG